MLINKRNNEDFLVRDPVCGMRIEPEYAADVDFYKGKIFYFCAQSCKQEFNNDPEKYFSANFGKDYKNEQSRKE